jgi:hypothetical protein
MFPGRVSPTTAKASVPSEPPPGPTEPAPPELLPALELLLDALVVLEVLEALELPLEGPPQPAGASWHLVSWVLHHQPPQQPLAWQVCVVPQPVQLACTVGPTRTPHVVAPPDEVLVELDPPTLAPHALTGTHALPGLPSTVAIAVHE